MEDDRDIVVFSDDDGNEFELEVIDYFDYEDQEYAVLVDPATCECDDEDCECETEVYIMKVLVNGDMEEFLPADDDKMEALSEIVEERGLGQINDDSALQAIVGDVLQKNEKVVMDYKNGKTNALGFLVGQCMRATKGQGNPAALRELLLKQLG